MNRIYKRLFSAACIGIFAVASTVAQTNKAKPKPTPKPIEKTAAKENSKDDKNYRLVKEGIGFNRIIVGKSTMKDVEKKFGKNFKTIKHKKYSVQMQYSNGLSFYACQADKRSEIFDIELKTPFKAKTGKGIILGKSTVEDVRKTYGKSIGDKTEEDLEFRGVSFFYNNTKGKKIITVIDIVENAGIRQCKEAK